MDKVYLTQEKYTKILTELNQLKTVGRNEVAKRLKQAKELGDLSENSEYQEAREQYSRVEQKIVQLEELIRNALIINSDNNREASSGIIRIGSRVTIMKDDSEEVVYVIRVE
ncbi:MAG: Transcription elongation factor [Candidatus Jorgensenbacteria bacterium GW2011_GWA2_45_9]|uniref:Transcription elongation factor GreA n=1 Tax=Candidatus Jorgensenbacteria bacterium GW2011_GWA2_45_9 TaxID=1618663 RepID=A0A0G1N519_9BACT|nr:MAG: Transcription elongation factor [Candidatus Jorgensenbacteria bacterium GW2011_GWA2_45_9]